MTCRAHVVSREAVEHLTASQLACQAQLALGEVTNISLSCSHFFRSGSLP